MTIGEICTREVVTADQACSLQEAAALMRERHVGTLVVTEATDEGVRVAGIVTDRDMVIEAMARGLDASRTELGRLANTRLATLPADEPIDEALAVMKEQGVRRLLVSDEHDQLYGIVSLDDIVGALADEMSDMASAVRTEVWREAAERDPLQPESRLRVAGVASSAP